MASTSEFTVRVAKFLRRLFNRRAIVAETTPPPPLAAAKELGSDGMAQNKSEVEKFLALFDFENIHDPKEEIESTTTREVVGQLQIGGKTVDVYKGCPEDGFTKEIRKMRKDGFI